MRFLANGPAIPDELLIARDEGNVIFFCGAGVSRAGAGLPTFLELAERVTRALEGPYESPTRRIIKLMQDLEEREGIPGLISADRVFSYLEREFESRDIHAAVARELKHDPDVDLSAHRMLLELSTSIDKRPRLVTTNFDLLFEACDASLTISDPSRLPDPQRRAEMQGVIHLHGRVTDDYSGAAGEGFVLSTAEFGRAYVSDGWATAFIRAVLEEYLVVFVGYTADDPPVQYLLEGLRDDIRLKQRMYAFHAAAGDDAEMRWRHKGVEPIEYVHTPDHAHLWHSLEQWTTRARDPNGWCDSVIDAARRGPAELQPHERGQVAHIVSTHQGARRFAEAEPPPPAEWLCVFDSMTRYARPFRVYGSGESSELVDPFEFYCLDSDQTPPNADPDAGLPKREIPATAWDAFIPTRGERAELKPGQVPMLRGYYSTTVPSLTPRLWYLGGWIARVATEPAAVWWASAQGGLHPDVQRRMIVGLDHNQGDVPAQVREAWRHLFEAWQVPQRRSNSDFFDLRKSVAKNGWTPGTARQLARCHRPHLTAERPWSAARPPQKGQEVRLSDLVKLDVKYPRLASYQIDIPDERLLAVVREYRKNLETATLLELELGIYALDHIAAIEPDDDPPHVRPRHLDGLSSELIYFAGLMQRLIEQSEAAAKQEVAAWWPDDCYLFARLRIWMCTRPQVDGQEVGTILGELTRETFWKRDHQRDLLLALAARWKDMAAEARGKLERQLLEGPTWNASRADPEDAASSAWHSLHRIQWLREHGVAFGFDAEQEIARLRKLAPEWQAEYAAVAAESAETKTGWVRSDEEFRALLGIPLREVLKRAHELSRVRAERFVEQRPFAGLASKRPIRALSALTLTAKDGDFPAWAWTTFLHSDARKTDPRRRALLIAARLTRIPVASMGELAQAITYWLERASINVLVEAPDLFDAIAKVIVQARGADRAEKGDTGARASPSQPDWLGEALGSPVGSIASLLVQDSSLNEVAQGQGLPQAWKDRIERLLELQGDPRRHVMTILAQCLTFLHSKDPAWTETHLLTPLMKDASDAAAVWSGFLRRVNISPALLVRLKEPLLGLPRADWIVKHGQMEVVANLLLLAWGEPPQQDGDTHPVTNAELHRALIESSNVFRSQFLWILERLCKAPVEETDARTDAEPVTPSVEGEMVRHWHARTRMLLSDVWPRNKSIKTAQTSARLCELAFSSPELFAEIADIVRRLVVRIDGEHLMLYEFIEGPARILEPHTEKVLALLHAVLSHDIRYWPDGINGIIDRIGQLKPGLLQDARLIELRRRWDAR